MGLGDNIRQINDVLKEKKSVQNTIRKINKENDEEQAEEEQLNSVIQELMNIYYSVKQQASLTNIQLNSFVIEPKNVKSSNAGTIRDPRVFLEYAKHHNEFSKRFDIEELSTDTGNERYRITEKNFEIR